MHCLLRHFSSPFPAALGRRITSIHALAARTPALFRSRCRRSGHHPTLRRIRPFAIRSRTFQRTCLQKRSSGESHGMTTHSFSSLPMSAHRLCFAALFTSQPVADDATPSCIMSSVSPSDSFLASFCALSCGLSSVAGRLRFPFYSAFSALRQDYYSPVQQSEPTSPNPEGCFAAQPASNPG